ncbi:MAG: hypothetical protein QM647_18785 [Asticcacaulis sp.]|uniref:hypothetical protein n=1 Tax=Asticcacaulis sp. TaxID=1872648 RepID=UPI0039E30A89
MKRHLYSLLTTPLLFFALGAFAQAPDTGAPPAGGPPPDGQMPTGAEFIARLDTNKDGVADKTEAAADPRFAGDFDKIDTDHDGHVTPQEMTTFFAAMGAPKPQGG